MHRLCNWNSAERRTWLSARRSGTSVANRYGTVAYIPRVYPCVLLHCCKLWRLPEFEVSALCIAAKQQSLLIIEDLERTVAVLEVILQVVSSAKKVGRPCWRNQVQILHDQKPNSYNRGGIPADVSALLTHPPRHMPSMSAFPIPLPAAIMKLKIDPVMKILAVETEQPSSKAWVNTLQKGIHQR